jgi:PAS domain S-box-containing protein
VVVFDPFVRARDHEASGAPAAASRGLAPAPPDEGWVVSERASRAAVVVTDGTGVVVHWSGAAERLYGWPRTEAQGRHLGDLLADRDDVDAMLAEVRRLCPGEARSTVREVRHRDGDTLTAHVEEAPVFDAMGGLRAVVVVTAPAGARAALGPAARPVAAPPAPPAPPEEADAAGRATDRLRRLQEITAELSRAMTTDEVARTVLRRGMEIEGAGSGALWLLDEASGMLRYVASANAAPGAMSRFTTIPLDASLPGPDAVRSALPIYIRSVADRDARWPGLAGTPSAMQAQAIHPLVVDGRAIGCLSFGFPVERDFGQAERDFLTALTNVCAQVFDRARLYDAERAASARVAFLAEASRVLNSSLDYQVTLERVVALLLDAFAALVAIDVVTGDGTVERVALGHVDPTKQDALNRLRHNPVRPGTNTWEVLRTGVPRIIDEISDDDMRRAAGGDAALFEAAREIAYGPAMVVPMAARARTVGVLFIARPRGEAPFTEDDLALAVDLAARAGGAVDNARLFAAQAGVAQLLQRSLLPPRLPDVPGVELGARYRPAYAGLEVGGDFYDCYAVGDGWAFMIGDVVGTGPAAAAVTALVRHTARAVAPYVDGPGAVTLAIRDALVASGDDEVFCTLLYGAVERLPDGVRLSVVGAGHPAPYVVRADGTIEIVVTHGGLLGILPPLDLEPVEVLLRPGDTFVGVTDGVLEARPAPTWESPQPSHGFFDEEGLLAVLASCHGRSADEVAGAIEDAVLAFTAGRAPDDLAVLVLRAV